MFSTFFCECLSPCLHETFKSDKIWFKQQKFGESQVNTNNLPNLDWRSFDAKENIRTLRLSSIQNAFNCRWKKRWKGTARQTNKHNKECIRLWAFINTVIVWMLPQKEEKEWRMLFEERDFENEEENRSSFYEHHSFMVDCLPSRKILKEARRTWSWCDPSQNRSEKVQQTPKKLLQKEHNSKWQFYNLICSL